MTHEEKPRWMHDPTKSAPGKVWIEPGTGKATVTRTYTGVLIGANLDWYITELAAIRIDKHEELHVEASRKAHHQHIRPLEERVAQRTGKENAESAKNRIAAMYAIKQFLNWEGAIKEFKLEDKVQNSPGGMVDQEDHASDDYPVDDGPKKVNGVSYNHYVRLPSEKSPS